MSKRIFSTAFVAFYNARFWEYGMVYPVVDDPAYLPAGCFGMGGGCE